jgi:hypothetical protein
MIIGVSSVLCAVTAVAQAPGATARRVAAQAREYDRSEATAAEVVAAALRARLSEDRVEELSGWARASGLVPVLRVSGRRGQALDLSAWRTTDDGRTVLSTDDELALEASLTFDLDRLLFHPDEVAIAREQRAEDDRRMNVIRTVVQVFFERRRLMLERDLAGRRDLGTLVRIAELGALLDAFTGGAFNRMMARRRR